MDLIASGKFSNIENLTNKSSIKKENVDIVKPQEDNKENIINSKDTKDFTKSTKSSISSFNFISELLSDSEIPEKPFMPIISDDLTPKQEKNLSQKLNLTDSQKKGLIQRTEHFLTNTSLFRLHELKVDPMDITKEQYSQIMKRVESYLSPLNLTEAFDLENITPPLTDREKNKVMAFIEERIESPSNFIEFTELRSPLKELRKSKKPLMPTTSDDLTPKQKESFYQKLNLTDPQKKDIIKRTERFVTNTSLPGVVELRVDPMNLTKEQSSQVMKRVDSYINGFNLTAELDLKNITPPLTGEQKDKIMAFIGDKMKNPPFIIGKPKGKDLPDNLGKPEKPFMPTIVDNLTPKQNENLSQKEDIMERTEKFLTNKSLFGLTELRVDPIKLTKEQIPQIMEKVDSYLNDFDLTADLELDNIKPPLTGEQKDKIKVFIETKMEMPYFPRPKTKNNSVLP